jgi:hypothetical protein
MDRCRLNTIANRTCMHHVSKIELLRALLALILFGFMTPQGMATALAASPEPIQSPSDTANVMRTVLTWLECEECIDGELKAVIRLHNIAVPHLSTALREGPSPSSLEIYRRELMRSYTRMVQYHGSTASSQLAMTPDEYRALHLGNYVRLYQIRALTALSMIGGTTATVALGSALQTPLPREIEIRVREALASRERQYRKIQ